jgi:UDP-glucose:(heptosyl)LPS alpha-1,3-glucosyltransferase
MNARRGLLGRLADQRLEQFFHGQVQEEQTVTWLSPLEQQIADQQILPRTFQPVRRLFLNASQMIVLRILDNDIGYLNASHASTGLRLLAAVRVYYWLLKIALVIFHSDPARGGAERYTADLAAALVARKHHVSILATDFGPRLAGVEYVALKASATSRTAQFMRFLDSLDAHVSDHSYDIVHAMLPVRQCDVYHPHAGLALESVRTGHRKHASPISRAASKLGNQLNRKRQRFAEVEKTLLSGKRPPVLLCLSEYVKKSVRRYYDLSEDRMATLFNAVDLSRFDPSRQNRQRDREELKIPADRAVALMVAQDFARKGLRQAIAAIGNVNDPRLLLLVVGKDKTKPYERLAASGGVARQIRFIGPVDDPRPFYSAADFFVLPTSHDPCSLVVLESLAMGLPVISTAFNGACQIMDDGKHGIVLPDPKDVAALAGAMRSMLDENLRSAMRSACLQLRPRLSLDAHVDRLLSIYASCKSFSQKSTARSSV